MATVEFFVILLCLFKTLTLRCAEPAILRSKRQSESCPTSPSRYNRELQDADCKYLKLSTIPSRFGEYERSQITKLSFQNNRLIDVTYSQLSEFTRLYDLDLANNQIENVDNDAFKSTRGLAYLVMRSNKLRTIPSRAFANLENMIELDLSENLQLRYDTTFVENLHNPFGHN